ncbi:MAG: ABC transporter ATP-binding protein, partial [Pseudomonadota bacterium]
IQDPVLSLFGLVVMPAAVYGVTLLVRRVKHVMKQELAAVVKIVASMQETVQGIRVIKSFGLENDRGEVMGGHIEGVRQRANKIAMLNSAPIPLTDTLGGIAVAGVVIYGGYSIILSDQDAGSLFSFITALIMASEPARKLSQVRVKLESLLVGVRLIYEVMDIPSVEAEEPGRPQLDVRDGTIKFDAVSFFYDPEKPVLRNLSVTIPGGQTVALVGPSGGGKSTILNLVPRFFSPKSGCISIDDQDISQVALKSLRENLSYVGQDIFLFDSTVLDNIRMGRLDATDEEVVEAAKKAHAHEFIVGMPGQYHARVGEGGQKLSGGQRQRIALASAILKEAPILLLDEATSALDVESENVIQEALMEFRQGRTVLVIAHRLSTVMDADTIIVIEQGEVREAGSHDELSKRDARYADLLKIYLGGRK